MAFQQAGLEWLNQNLSTFLSGADRGSKAMGDVGDKAGGVAPKFSLLTGVVTGVATALTTALIGAVTKAGRAIVGLGQESVAMAGAFQGMASRLTIAAGEAGLAADQFGGLSEVALMVGGDTRLLGVSAVGAADAMTGLLKAGVPLEDVMGDLNAYMSEGAELGGLLRASIDLAAATELDMVAASDLASVSMATYGLTTDETAQAMDFMVRAADASVASVSGLRDSMTNVGASASAMGFDLYETNTALAILSSRGIVGAEAGTALKSMFTNLMRQTPKVTDALEEQGIALYDNEGGMLSMIEIIGQFQTATEDMTTEQRNQFIQTVAGTYGMKSMNTLLGEGVQGWHDMEAAIGGATGITAQAEAAAATYGGQMESLEGNMETLKIRIGTALLPTLTDMIGLFSGFIDVVGPGVVAAFEWIGAKLSIVTGYLKDLFAKYQEGGLAAIFNIPENTMSTLAFLKDALLKLFGGEMEDGLLRIQHVIQETFGMDAAQKFNSLRVWLNETIPQAVEKAKAALDVIKDLFGMGPEQSEADEQRGRWVAAMGGTELEKPADKIREVFGNVKDFVVNIVGKITDALGVVKSWLDENWPSIKETILGVFGKVKSWVDENWPSIKETVLDVFTKISDFVSEHGDTIMNVVLGIAAGFAAFSVLSTILPPLLTFIGLMSMVFSSGGVLTVGLGFVGALVAALGGPLTIAIAAVAAIIALFVGNVGGIRDKVMPIFENIAIVWKEEVMPALMEAWDAIKEAFGSISEIFGESGESSIDWGGVLEVVVDTVVGAIQILGAIIAGVMTAAAGIIKFFAGVFRDNMANVKGYIDGVKVYIEGFKDLFSAKSWGDIGKALKKIFKGAGKMIVNFGKMLLRSFTLPLVAIGKFVGGFVKGIIKFFTGLKDKIVGKSIVPDMMEKIQDVIETVLDAVGKFIETALAIIEKVFKDTFDAIKEKVVTVIESVQDTIEKAIGVIQSAWETFTDILRKDWDTLWSAITDRLDNARDAIESAINTLKLTIEGIWTTFLENLQTAWDTLWTNLTEGLSAVWASIQEAISAGIAAVLQLLADAVGSFLDAGTALTTAIRDGISNAWHFVTTAITDGLTAIVTTITNAAATMLEAGTAIVDNIKEGISNAWDTVTTLFGDLICGIKESFMTGGSLVMQLLAAGAELVNGIKKGLENTWSNITTAIGTLLTSLADGTIWGNIASAGGKIVDALIAGIQTHWQSFIDWLLAAIGNIFDSGSSSSSSSSSGPSSSGPSSSNRGGQSSSFAQAFMPMMQPTSLLAPSPVGSADNSRHITVEVNPTYANIQSEASIFYDVTAALQAVAM